VVEQKLSNCTCSFYHFFPRSSNQTNEWNSPFRKSKNNCNY